MSRNKSLPVLLRNNADTAPRITKLDRTLDLPTIVGVGPVAARKKSDDQIVSLTCRCGVGGNAAECRNDVTTKLRSGNRMGFGSGESNGSVAEYGFSGFACST